MGPRRFQSASRLCKAGKDSRARGSPGISVFLQEDGRMFHWTELSLPTNYALKASGSERAGTNSFHINGYKLEDI